MGLGHYILQSLSPPIPKVSLNRTGFASGIAEIETKGYVWDDNFPPHPVKLNLRKFLSVLEKRLARNTTTIFYRGKPDSLGSDVVKEKALQV